MMLEDDYLSLLDRRRGHESRSSFIRRVVVEFLNR
jgi:hypothetical protein